MGDQVNPNVNREIDSSGLAEVNVLGKLENVGDATNDCDAVNLRTMHANTFRIDSTSGIRRIGVKANVAGSGIAMTATRERIGAIYADDGGVQIATGNSVCAFEGRTVIGFSHGNVDMSIGGVQGHVKVASGITSPGNGCQYGLWGYFETIGTAVTGGGICCGVMAMIDVISTAYVTAGAVASGLYIKSGDVSGGRNSTGKVVCIRADAPGAGNWDAFLYLQSSNGLAVANTSKVATGGDACIGVIYVNFNGTLGYVPILSVVPHV
jgi:hypothetical protein